MAESFPYTFSARGEVILEILLSYVFVHRLGVSIRKRYFFLLWGRHGNALNKWCVSKGGVQFVACKPS
jgi:hypothetical protein